MPPAGSLHREPTDLCPPVPAEDLQLGISIWKPCYWKFCCGPFPFQTVMQSQTEIIICPDNVRPQFSWEQVAFHTSGISSAKTLSCTHKRCCSHDRSPGAPAMLEVKDFASQQGGVSN